MDYTLIHIYYLLLVAGVMLTVMAIFTPGTGMLEVGAVFALLFAGFGILTQPINLWALFILLLGVFPFLLALRKPGRLLLLAIADVAFVVGSAFLFRGEKWWQPAVNPFLALITSALSSWFLWLAARKALEAWQTRPAHDLNALIGAIGEAKTEIAGEGSVQVNGELWSARSETHIPAGASVRVIRRDGFLLEVKQDSGSQS
ncbi:MAG: hypothetical protein JW726_01775 [Anaerolineales bacterium]|nr:hypothetical protein [Anaerolineales bacterium]